jgi:hypothetical protein
VKIHPSALKHGIASEDAIQAADWPLWIEPGNRNGPTTRPVVGGESRSGRRRTDL